MAQPSLEVGFASDVGRLRQRNEDSFKIFIPFGDEAETAGLDGLLIIADGMGGEKAGDRASQLAVQRLEHWLSSGAHRSWPEYSGEDPFGSALIKAIREVSDEIFRLGDQDADIKGLGCTVVVAAFRKREVVVAHVGDSRCYLIRSDRIEQLTTDHTWVQRQVESGALSAQEAESHPQRNILTRSLGDAIAPAVDLTRRSLRENDLLLLCTDGLTGEVSDREILEICLAKARPSGRNDQNRQLQLLVEELISTANLKDGSDNVTVIAGRCSAELTNTAEPPAVLSDLDSEDDLDEEQTTELQPQTNELHEDSLPSQTSDLEDTLILPPTPGRFRRLVLPQLIRVVVVLGLGVVGAVLESSWHQRKIDVLFARAEEHSSAGRDAKAREAIRELLELNLGSEQIESLYRLMAPPVATDRSNDQTPTVGGPRSSQKPDS